MLNCSVNSLCVLLPVGWYGQLKEIFYFGEVRVNKSCIPWANLTIFLLLVFCSYGNPMEIPKLIQVQQYHFFFFCVPSYTSGFHHFAYVTIF